MADLNEAATKYVRLVGANEKLVKELTNLPGVKLQTRENSFIEFTSTGDINAVLKLLSHAKLTDLTITEADLEATFMHYYQEEQPDV
jgi:hypothetical protein